ncbi:TPR-like protein, partial [Lentithecium fluviatile CBS 122367]
WIVPFERNPRFTGRETQLAQLEEMLFTEGRSGDHTTKAAIIGLGGVGKTQLTLEFLFRMRKKYPDCSIVWIPATSSESLHRAYLAVAQELGMPGWEDKEADVKGLVQEYLSKESTGQWLLVFDNADDIDMWIAKAGSKPQSGQGSQPLIDYLPKSKQGTVLFTTRNRKLAVQLAQNNIDTSTLLLQLTYLPLAIVQAAAYINENGMILTEYLSLLAEQETDVIDLLSKDFEDDSRYPNVKNPVATTWLVSFKQIQERDSLAAEYLSLMACVEPKDIPQYLLPIKQSKLRKMEAIGTLDAYSFVNRRRADQCLDLHRLVYLATRNWLRKQGHLAQWTEKTIERLEEVFPDHSHENRNTWRMYLSHVRFALRSEIIHETKTKLMWRYGLCLYREGIQGRWKKAEDLGVQVMEARKRVSGTDHLDTLTAMANLARNYWDQGQWKEAEKLQVQILVTREIALGQNHPDTLTSMANLASTHRSQGRWQEAEQLELQVVQVVEARKRVLGADHPYTLTTMSNLASTYNSQERWKEAEDLGSQVVEARERVLGADHVNTLTSIHILALTYRSQKKWKEAAELGMRVVEARKRVLGADHPYTLTSMSNLASTYNSQERWKEAKDLGSQVVEARKRVLGADHVDTLTSMHILALTYRNQKKWKEAAELGMQVVEARKRVLGADHPYTLTSMSNLASTYNSQERWKEAEDLGSQVMEARKRVLGADHVDTLTSMHILALTYDGQKKWNEEAELEVQVVEARKKVLGADHPYTLTTMSNLAYTWKDLGRDAQAIGLMRECVRLRELILGVGHPDFTSSLNTLARWEEEQE